ncbi:MAG: hypothetical protein IKY64_02485 [Bacteroidaceae bacterium]|nr:hypothetical protein [Bacteroidaceae bacterium]
MTEKDRAIIANFESKLGRLMDVYTQLAAENAVLRERMGQQAEELERLRKQYDELSISYSDLKLAKIISVNDTELGDTQRRLSKLVREVDKCIALLNASEQKDDVL